MIRQEPDRPPHLRFDVPEFLLDYASIDHEEEHGRRRGSGGIQGERRVFDSGALGVELTGDVGLRDASVVRGKGVAGEAEGADPDLGSEVDAGERVKGGGARGLAPERRVRKDEEGS